MTPFDFYRSLKDLPLTRTSIALLNSSRFFAKEKLYIILHRTNSRYAKIFHQHIGDIRAEESRQSRSKMNIFYTQIQQSQQYNDRLLLIPGDIVDNGKVIDIIQSKTSFNFKAMRARE